MARIELHLTPTPPSPKLCLQVGIIMNRGCKKTTQPIIDNPRGDIFNEMWIFSHKLPSCKAVKKDFLELLSWTFSTLDKICTSYLDILDCLNLWRHLLHQEAACFQPQLLVLKKARCTKNSPTLQEEIWASLLQPVPTQNPKIIFCGQDLHNV